MPTRQVRPEQFAELWVVLLLLGGVGIAVIVSAWKRRPDRSIAGAWPQALLHAAVGLSAALIFLRIPAWSYATALDDMVRVGSAAPMWSRHSVAISMFAGSSVSAILGSSFQWVAPSVVLLARRFLGGAVMAASAHWVPGGNDLLLLWVIPSLAAYGAVAYLLMTGAISAVLRIDRVLTTRRYGVGAH